MVDGFENYMRSSGNDSCLDFDRGYSGRLIRNRMSDLVFDHAPDTATERKAEAYADLAEIYLTLAISGARQNEFDFARNMNDGYFPPWAIHKPQDKPGNGVEGSITLSRLNGGEPERLKELEVCSDALNEYINEQLKNQP